MSGFIARIELAALNGNDGLRIIGESASDYSGSVISSAGDVNGDGFDDIIVGASYADANGNVNCGASYVVFGKAGGFGAILDLAALDGSNGFQITGSAPGDLLGISVSGAGDVNGDGFADLIVGAPAADTNGSSSGVSYVVFGKSSAFSSNLDVSSLNGMNGFKINGAAVGDYAGRSVSSAGDVNGDGLTDIVIGSPYSNSDGSNSGAAYIVFGRNTPFDAQLELSALDGNTGFRISGEVSGNNAGISVESAGDVNGDGFDDIIVSARRTAADFTYGQDTGASYVVFGKATGFDSNLSLSALDGQNGFQLRGQSNYDQAGRLQSAGDINGDGFDDLIAMVRYSSYDNFTRGYVIFGKSGGFSGNFDTNGISSSDGFGFVGKHGYSVEIGTASAAGDQNGDGIDDIILTEEVINQNGDYETTIYVVYGRSTSFGSAVNLHSLNANTGFMIAGPTKTDNAGSSLALAGDINGDGFDDILVGAMNSHPTLYGSGSTYVIFGKRFSALPEDDSLLFGTEAADTLAGFGGHDTLMGNGANDSLDGGADNDTLDGGAGSDTLNGGAGNDHYFVDSSSDLVIDSGGVDTIQTDVFSISLVGSDIEHGILYGDTAINLTGSDVANALTGNISNNILSGLEGNDTIFGGDGSDTLNGGVGADSMRGDAGSDTYFVNSIGDMITETGNDRDSVFSSINYNLKALVENGFLTGGAARNLVGNAAANFLEGNKISNKISGAAGNDTIVGKIGNDTLSGSSGSDIIIGSKGNDSMSGGQARDFFVFNTGSGKDVVTDFLATGNNHDIVDLRSFDVVISFVDLKTNHMRQAGGDVVITGGSGDVITLEDTRLSDLGRVDFLI
jgi:Ca2+-binding RTX toxin-like protein